MHFGIKKLFEKQLLSHYEALSNLIRYILKTKYQKMNPKYK